MRGASNKAAGGDDDGDFDGGPTGASFNRPTDPLVLRRRWREQPMTPPSVVVAGLMDSSGVVVQILRRRAVRWKQLAWASACSLLGVGLSPFCRVGLSDFLRAARSVSASFPPLLSSEILCLY
jgi:hypothetical protein